ncbi:MAG TPA: ABC transporter permease [Parvularculaceae bacterium]|nr:ABC transporter permease [Parvularculaceae bacterium]
MNVVAATGRGTLAVIREIGRISIFAVQGALAWASGPIYWRALGNAALRIGFNSLPVVGLTAIFTGAALALNIWDGSLRFNAETFLPQILGVSITRELGPVLAALMISGRSSSAMAAELGAMRVSEQIDAMKTLNVDPFKYLVSPRVVATTLMLPFLVLVADIVGIYGGYLVAVHLLDFAGPVYLRNIADFLTTEDIVSGLIKAGVFGFLLSVMGCYYGYNSKGGAQGVGAATRAAVVASAVLILASNYLMTSFFVHI